MVTFASWVNSWANDSLTNVSQSVYIHIGTTIIYITISIFYKNKMETIAFNFDSVPSTWEICFNKDCPRKDTCMRYFVGTTSTRRQKHRLRRLPQCTTKRQMRVLCREESDTCSMGIPSSIPQCQACRRHADTQRNTAIPRKPPYLLSLYERATHAHT